MGQTRKHKLLKFALLVLILGGVFFVFKHFNPSQHSFFYSCPILKTTGYQCAGCGSQRALHQLFHFNLIEAFRLNPLFVISLPFLLLGVGLKVWNFTFEKKYHIPLFYNNKAIISYIIIIILFAILRNLL